MFLIACIGITGTLLGEAPAAKFEYPCHQMKEAPVIDGKIDAAWDAVPWQGGFLIFPSGNGYATEKPTSFKAGWTKDSLCLLVKCLDGKPGTLKSKGSEATLWNEDGMELFFAPGGGRACRQLIVNVAGLRWNGVNGTADALWDWEAKAEVTADGWVVEVRVPFRVLERTPEAGERWRVNVARNALAGTGSERLTCWPPLMASFHDIQNFGVFVFSGPADSAVAREEQELNAGYRQFLSARINEIANGLIEGRKVVESGQKFEGLKPELARLAEAWSEMDGIMADKYPPLEKMSGFVMNHGDLKKTTKDIQYRVLTEELLSRNGK